MRIQGKNSHFIPRKSLITSTIGTMAESTLATGMPRRANSGARSFKDRNQAQLVQVAKLVVH
jgi:hypothetical protein